MVPVSFVSEHIETLEEIDMEYRELAEEHGVTHWERAPAVNTEQTFIEDVADMVVSSVMCVLVVPCALAVYAVCMLCRCGKCVLSKASVLRVWTGNFGFRAVVM